MASNEKVTITFWCNGWIGKQSEWWVISRWFAKRVALLPILFNSFQPPLVDSREALNHPRPPSYGTGVKLKGKMEMEIELDDLQIMSFLLFYSALCCWWWSTSGFWVLSEAQLSSFPPQKPVCDLPQFQTSDIGFCPLQKSKDSTNLG